MKVVHVGQIHKPDDIRIFQKECQSLVKAGYDVTYYTSDATGSAVGANDINGVKIRIYPYRRKEQNGTGFIKLYQILYNRISRPIMSCVDIKNENPDIVHIHEPQLLYLALIFKSQNIRVVYDVHEDTPREASYTIYKKYGATMGKFSERGWEFWERFFCKFTDVVVTVTPHIRQILARYTKNVYEIRNYPIIHSGKSTGVKDRDKIIGYGGGISSKNGIKTLLEIQNRLKAKIYLAGTFGDIDYRKEVLEQFPREISNGKIKYWGNLSVKDMEEFYSEIYLGVCIYKNIPNNYWGLPNKLLEYMERGIPVVASNFPLYRQIVMDSKCGLLVNPDNPREIVDAINWLLENPDEAHQMGMNGRKAILERYNWEHEERKLLKLYNGLV